MSSPLQPQSNTRGWNDPIIDTGSQHKNGYLDHIKRRRQAYRNAGVAARAEKLHEQAAKGTSEPYNLHHTGPAAHRHTHAIQEQRDNPLTHDTYARPSTDVYGKITTFIGGLATSVWDAI